MDTDKALTLREASNPPVQYIPLTDIDPDAIRHTDTHTYYEDPYDAVAEIGGHVAFYPDQVEITIG